MRSLAREAWFGLKTFYRGRGSNPGDVLMLAVGFAAVCTVATAGYRLLWAPLPYQRSENLVQVSISLDGSAYQSELSGHEIDLLQRRSHTLEDVAGIWLRRTPLGGGQEDFADQASDAQLAIVTWNLFDLLGAGVERGRGLQPRDAAANAAPVALLSHRVWVGRFSAHPNALGAQVLVNGVPTRVVGILQAGFQLFLPAPSSAAKVDVWVPNREELSREFHHRFAVLGQLAPGISPSQAQSELDALAPRLDLTNAAYGALPARFRVERLSSRLATPHRLPVGLLAAAAAGLLLLVSFNLSAQHLSRAQGFEREAAVRMALGASRIRLAGRMAAQTAALMLPAAGLGLLAASWVLDGLASQAPLLPPQLQAPSLGPEAGLAAALAFCLAACGYATPLMARLRAMQVADGLRASSPRLFSGSRRLRHGLAAAQIAGCAALLLGTGWLLQSFRGLLDTDPGFQSERVISFSASLPGGIYHEPELRSGFARRMTARLQAIPSVEAAGAVSDLPLSGTSRRGVYAFPSRAGRGQADFRYVVPGYFEALGIRLQQGRLFEQRDLDANLSVAVIDSRLAREGWPNQEPIGERILLPTSDGDASWRTVIGVVDNVRQASLAETGGRQVYLTMADRSVPRMFFVLRHAPESAANWNQAIREAVGEVDPRVAAAQIRPMREWVEESAASTRFLATLLAAFACVALLTAGMGLHAALSSLTTERRGEIGLRMAVGARPADILRWAASQTLALTLWGTLSGLLIALLGWRLYGQLLYQSGPSDWPTLLAALAVLLATAAASSLAPALRATRTDPASALRSE